MFFEIIWSAVAQGWQIHDASNIIYHFSILWPVLLIDYSILSWWPKAQFQKAPYSELCFSTEVMCKIKSVCRPCSRLFYVYLVFNQSSFIMFCAYLKLSILWIFRWQVKYAPERYSWFSLFMVITFYKIVAANIKWVSTKSLLQGDISSYYGKVFSYFSCMK